MVNLNNLYKSYSYSTIFNVSWGSDGRVTKKSKLEHFTTMFDNVKKGIEKKSARRFQR